MAKKILILAATAIALAHIALPALRSTELPSAAETSLNRAAATQLATLDR